MARYFKKIKYEFFEENFRDFNDCNLLYEELRLPKRATKYSAGYDFFAPYDFEIQPGEIKKIPTGIKVNMNNDECLLLHIKSGHGFKNNIRFCNQVGVIDKDYFENKTNDGNIFVAIQNEGEMVWKIKKGSPFFQALFMKYLICEDEEEDFVIRTNGLGSTSAQEV